MLANCYTFKRHVLGHQEASEPSQEICHPGRSTSLSGISASKIATENHKYEIISLENNPDQNTPQGHVSSYYSDKEDIYRTVNSRNNIRITQRD